jgi:hypothetical protein
MHSDTLSQLYELRTFATSCGSRLLVATLGALGPGDPVAGVLISVVSPSVALRRLCARHLESG